ncbi:MAG: 30S ribosomal protein S6 [Chloroflexi bacterium ADurb.Bin325]|nr:MAG: 30S ribosomal protein S6 [Chloroflexi bacterium ADurb.Bin325]
MSDLRDYEMVYIAVPQLDDEGLATLNQRVAGWIAAANGAVTDTNVWGRRKLTYEIRKQTEGIYVQINFQLVPSATRELERNLRLDEQVIRHLVVRLGED